MTAMPMTSPDRIVLTDSQRGDLDRLVRAGRTEQRLALRAGIVLAAADGHPNARIAASLGICEDTARKWRHRWCAAPGVSSLGDAKRCGRPAVFTAVQVAQVKALACTPPKDRVAAVEMVVPGTGRARRQRRDLREHLALDSAQVAVRGCPQTVAVPVVDFHHGSELRRASAESVGSIMPGNGMGNRWAATTM